MVYSLVCGFLKWKGSSHFSIHMKILITSKGNKFLAQKRHENEMEDSYLLRLASHMGFFMLSMSEIPR